jgi:hypothetical protein
MIRTGTKTTAIDFIDPGIGKALLCQQVDVA